MNELRPQQCVRLGFTQKHLAKKLLPNWQLMAVLVSLKFLKPIKALTHCCCFPQLYYLQPKEFIRIKIL